MISECRMIKQLPALHFQVVESPEAKKIVTGKGEGILGNLPKKELIYFQIELMSWCKKLFEQGLKGEKCTPFTKKTWALLVQTMNNIFLQKEVTVFNESWKLWRSVKLRHYWGTVSWKGWLSYIDLRMFKLVGAKCCLWEWQVYVWVCIVVILVDDC